MNIEKKSGTYVYKCMFDYGYGKVLTEPFLCIDYTHEVVYRGALYYFGEVRGGTKCLLEVETGAVAVTQNDFTTKTTDINKYLLKLLEKENKYGKTMPEIIQKYKDSLNVIDVWQTNLYIGQL